MPYQSTFAIAPLIVGVDHNGANNGVNQPIAWQLYYSGYPAVRTADLTSGTFRDLLLWLPPRSRTGTGRVVINTIGTGASGTITRATYQVVRAGRPGYTQATDLFDALSGSSTNLSNLVTDGHASNGSDWITEVTTTIDLNASTDPINASAQLFQSLMLKVEVAYGTSARGMIITGMGVQNW